MTQSLQDDIDYMKSLARDGSAGPLRNGAVLFWAGLIFGAASVAQYALLVGALPDHPWTGPAIWLSAGAVFGVCLAMSLRGARAVPGAAARASNVAWSAVGVGTFFLFATLAAIMSTQANAFQLLWIAAPMVLLMYGMGWWISAAVSGQGWLKLVAFGCFIGAPVMGLLAGRPEQILVYAACLVLLASLPGLILMRVEKA